MRVPTSFSGRPCESMWNFPTARERSINGNTFPAPQQSPEWKWDSAKYTRALYLVKRAEDRVSHW